MQFKVFVFSIVSLLGVGCSGELESPVSSRHHEFTLLPQAADLTLSATGSQFMVDHWFDCKAAGTSDPECGIWALTITRNHVDRIVGSGARATWEDIIRYGFRNGMGADFTNAVYQLDRLNHECLRLHFEFYDNVPSTTTDWTTSNMGAQKCKP